MRQPADHDARHVLGRRRVLSWHAHGDVLGTLVGVFVIGLAV
jgi:hypothetical protein